MTRRIRRWLTSAPYTLYLRLLSREQLDVEALVLDLARASLVDSALPLAKKTRGIGEVLERTRLCTAEMSRRHGKAGGK